jgi:hypothetical protein
VCEDIDSVDVARHAEQGACGSPREGVFFDREPSSRKLALEDLPRVFVVRGSHEPRHGELAEQHGVVSHRARAR